MKKIFIIIAIKLEVLKYLKILIFANRNNNS